MADEATVVDLKGIVGRLCSENRREIVQKIKGAVDSLVSAFVDGFDAVTAQTSAAVTHRAEGLRGQECKLLAEKLEVCERKLQFSCQQRVIQPQKIDDMEMSFNSAFQRDLLSWDGSLRSLNMSRFAIRDQLHDMPAVVVHAAEQALHAILQ